MICDNGLSVTFRRGIGIIHTNPNDDPLSVKSHPPSQFACYDLENVFGERENEAITKRFDWGKSRRARSNS